MNRLLRRGAVVALFLPALAFWAPSANAHPLGNASVNHYNGLTLTPEGITNLVVEDAAEIPTVARTRSIDADGDGALAEVERTAYAAQRCADRAAATQLTVGGAAQTWSVTSSSYEQRPGAAGLAIGRLACDLRAEVALTSATTVALVDKWETAGLGWREMTATADGVQLTDSPVPGTSVSKALEAYPEDVLSSPPNVREITLAVTPGSGASTYAAADERAGTNWVTRTVDGWTDKLSSMVTGDLGGGVGVLAVLLAILLGAGHAMLPGHGKTIMAAYLVGKRGRLRDVVTVGATVTITHTLGVLILGAAISASATFAPTAVQRWLGVISGVIVIVVGLGLLLSAARKRHTKQAAVAEAVEAVARLDQRAPVTAGSRTSLPLLVSSSASGGGHAARHSAHTDHAHTDHAHTDHAHTDHAHTDHAHTDHAHGDHDHDHGHSHDAHSHDAHSHTGHAHTDHAHTDHDHGHSHDAHSHDAGHRHGGLGGWLAGAHSHGPDATHSHGPEDGFSRKGLIGLGAAGGLVPSPSALLVLLATVALGRTAFGVVLVLAYGLGMAGALTLAGALLVSFRNRIVSAASGRFGALTRVSAVLPVVTATLVVIVGIGLTMRSLGGQI